LVLEFSLALQLKSGAKIHTGAIGKKMMREFDESCLTEVEPTAEDIRHEPSGRTERR